MRYNPSNIESKWQNLWEEKKAFRTPDLDSLDKDKPKFYVLDMFPYPSGDGLHVGHPEGYTATDVISRAKRMQGCNVLHPMGWDSFGLPAERAAVRSNMHPAKITKRNIDNFRRQIKSLGFSYDWDREVTTSNPDYYKWTQWIFLQLYKKDLAYMAEVPVNWCPALGTVLANEEVKDGRYVETGDPVERRLMKQWMLKITAYAERLLEDLDGLDWPDGVKKMQAEWIGKSTGANITFKVSDKDLQFDVFTTRPDTLMGATYCVLAPEHSLVNEITTEEQQKDVQSYVEQALQKTDLLRTDLAKDKTGVFTGAYATHPVSGDKIPIWVADYILMSYGTGAIMAVPAHDERDHAFAKQFDLKIVEVIEGGKDIQEEAYVGDGVAVNSDFLNGLAVDAAKEKMINYLEENGHGSKKIQYRLRDWLFSRQRYWGEPFPIVHLEDGSMEPLPEECLPVELPNIDEYKPTEDGEPPLARADDSWSKVKLPDGREGTLGTNTMPQWAGSCWYYLRYLSAKNNDQAWTEEEEKYWMPVDLYVGGVEHAVLHLLYARFWHKVLFDCGLVSTKEPFQKLFNQGMILAYSFRDPKGKYYYPNEVEEKDGKFFVKETGVEVETQIEKMSKSRYNVVNPDEVVSQYGADAMRIYELFMGPLEQSKPWQMEGVSGVYKFLERTWRLAIDESSGELASKVVDEPGSQDSKLWQLLHKTIKKVKEDTEHLRFNTAISTMMEFVNAATKAKKVSKETLQAFLKILSPYAPHLAEELWERLGCEGFVSIAPWPEHDEALCIDEMVKIIIQINGKKRDEMEVARDTSKDELEKLALESEKGQKFREGKEVRKVIVVPGRLVNIVVG